MYFGMIKPLPTRNLINISAAALILLGGFFASPSRTSAELSFPATPCDDEQVDATLPIFGTSAHLAPGMIKEPGNVAFQYGADNNSFVSKSGDVITFNVNLLFTPDNPLAIIKLLAFDASCNIVFGFGPAFTELSPDREKVVTFDTATNIAAHEGNEQQLFPNFAPRYVWVEVVDQYPNANLKTYSYLVDILDPQNPTGQPDAEPPDEEPGITAPVIVIPGIFGSWNVGDGLKLDPIFHTYDNLVDALKLSGYQEGETLFTFPYQWRFSNSFTAIDLGLKVNEIQEVCQCPKVDIVAHSMGGLVARAYIQGPDYGDDVRKLIFLGTPQRGATEAYLGWEGGERGVSFMSNAFEHLLTLEAVVNHYPDLYSYIRGLPISSIRELLPIFDYLRDSSSQEPREYPNQYPINTFLEQLNELDLLSRLNTVDMLNILGSTETDVTVDVIRVAENPFENEKWEHGYPENYHLPFTDKGLERGSGDGTVPQRSNSNFHNSEQVVVGSNHVRMVTDAQKIIIEKLTGIEPAEEVRKGIFRRYLMVRIFSPVDFLIISPDGKKLGRDAGGDINEILGGFYNGSDSDIEFAVIPDPVDGEYQVKLVGTGEGPFTLSVSYLDDTTTLDKAFSDTIQPEQELSLEFEYQSNNENLITELVAQDITPPITAAIPTGKIGQNGWHRSKVTLALDATDDNSGVLQTEYSFDGGANWQEYSAPFQITTPGINEVLFFSTDRAGNQEEIQSIDIKIDKWAPDASFMFDPATRDVIFSGIDDQSNVTIQDLGNRVILTDEAGNTTVLNYKEKIKKQKSIELELTSISYNEKPKIKLSENETNYSWTLDRSGNITRLEQELEIKDNSISLSYSLKHNQTVVVEKMKRKKEKITLNGMIILKVKIEKGKIVHEY